MFVTLDTVRTPLGKKLAYGVVHKKPAALIIPWDGHYLYLVEQYRYPVKAVSFEFPSGHFEHRSVKETARFELHEEAGVAAKSVKEIGRFHVAPGHNTQVCHVFFATNLTVLKNNPEESEEGMTVRKVTLPGMKKLIDQGKIQDGPTLAAFAIASTKKLFS